MFLFVFAIFCPAERNVLRKNLGLVRENWVTCITVSWEKEKKSNISLFIVFEIFFFAEHDPPVRNLGYSWDLNLSFLKIHPLPPTLPPNTKHHQLSTVLTGPLCWLVHCAVFYPPLFTTVINDQLKILQLERRF